MRRELSLNGTWELRDEALAWSTPQARDVAKTAEGWIAQPVPGDIHQGLIDSGRIKEPLLGLNSFDCPWTEDRSWWFRRSFHVEPEWLTADVVELELNGLDSNAEIFVNGDHVGSHRSSFYPFIADVRPRLVEGENTVLVRLTAGVDTFSEADAEMPDGVRAVTEAGNGRPERGDRRRVLVRKPQFSFGWDWSPRLATTAIAGDVVLRAIDGATLRNVALRPVERGDAVAVEATVEIEAIHYYKTLDADVSIALTDAKGRRFELQRNVMLRSGLNYIDFSLPIDDPQLWWPAGLGEQHLYRVEASLSTAAGREEHSPFDWGLRFVELDTDHRFAVVVNGKKVFSKGANWIPADAIYARIDAERYERLVREAREANFNMLRIWGGGLYEPEAFYRACDREGILLWHDFMFACAPYPDHLEWFRNEVEREVEYQTKRLQRHACMALWSGSNENQWGFHEWWNQKTQGGAYAYNHILPRAVRRNCPEIPYWNGSPYGGDHPNCNECGDRHHWPDATMNADMNRRITPEVYDECGSLFVSEFGIIGACDRKTIEAYLDGAPLDPESSVWQHHNNTFEKKTTPAAIRKHYADPESIALDDYLLYSGLFQGLMYGYSLDSMRARPECHGGLFWMYADCWGEVGWTITDYYLRRKPAWWFVKRTFAPVRLILRWAGDRQGVRIVVANDKPEAVTLELEYGFVSVDGTVRDVQTGTFDVPALERAEVTTFPFNGHDGRHGLWYARALNMPEVPTGLFRAEDYRRIEVVDPGLTWSLIDGKSLRVSAEAYAHAVRLTLPEGCVPEDNYFDLLPGETRNIALHGNVPIESSAVEVTAVNTARSNRIQAIAKTP
jgi:beta-mannosidase